MDHFKDYKETGEIPSCTVGVDPFLMNQQQWNTLSTKLESAGHKTIPIEKNLVDLVWGEDRPARPNQAVVVLEVCSFPFLCFLLL